MSNNRTDLVSLAVMALCYGAYGWVAANTPTSLYETLGLVVGLYVGMTVAMIVAHVVVALLFFWAPDRQGREREKEIHRRAARNGYAGMMSVLWAAPFLLAMPDGEVLAVHAFVALMGIGEIVRHASLVAYRGFGPAQNQRALA